MTCKKNSWTGNLWRVTRKQMAKWSMLKIFKAKIFIDGFKYAKITILKRLISWLWEGCPDLNCRPAVCSLFNCISWTTPAFNISIIFVYCYVLLSRMFLFCIPALDCFKLLRIITFQEEQTSNSDEDGVEVKQRSCEAGQDNRPEIQDDSDKVHFQLLFAPAVEFFISVWRVTWYTACIFWGFGLQCYLGLSIHPMSKTLLTHDVEPVDPAWLHLYNTSQVFLLNTWFFCITFSFCRIISCGGCLSTY